MTKIPSVEEINGHRIIEQDETIKVYKGEVVLPISELVKYLTAERTALLTELREMIDRNDPNVKMERETNPAYWGNTLRAELDELIDPTSVVKDLKEEIDEPGSHNIAIGIGADTDHPTDSYMLVLGNWKQKMTREQYAEAIKAVTMQTIINENERKKSAEQI